MKDLLKKGSDKLNGEIVPTFRGAKILIGLKPKLLQIGAKNIEVSPTKKEGNFGEKDIKFILKDKLCKIFYSFNNNEEQIFINIEESCFNLGSHILKDLTDLKVIELIISKLK